MPYLVTFSILAACLAYHCGRLRGESTAGQGMAKAVRACGVDAWWDAHRHEAHAERVEPMRAAEWRRVEAWRGN